MSKLEQIEPETLARIAYCVSHWEMRSRPLDELGDGVFPGVFELRILQNAMPDVA